MNKLLTVIEGTPLVNRVVQEICLSSVSEVIFVYREEEVKSAVEMLDIQCVYNPNANLGMSESLKVGMKIADQSAEGYMFFVGDQVFLTHQIIDEIIMESNRFPEDIIIPRCRGKRTNPVYFPRKYRDELSRVSGDEGGRQIIRKQEEGLRFFEIESESFCLDLDTVEDLEDINRVISKKE
jgi:molybdenum cofactor cytidylyltransferase